jgi:hypothetical protein
VLSQNNFGDSDLLT